jgi:hypothetical protein
MTKEQRDELIELVHAYGRAEYELGMAYADGLLNKGYAMGSEAGPGRTFFKLVLAIDELTERESKLRLLIERVIDAVEADCAALEYGETKRIKEAVTERRAAEAALNELIDGFKLIGDRS